MPYNRKKAALLTPVDFVRQRAAMIDQWGRGDPHLLEDNIKFFADLAGCDSAALASEGQSLCDEQRNMLIGSDMYLFTPELAECAWQALAQLDPGEHLDLDPLPVGGVFAFTEPVRAPGTPGDDGISVLLPMPELFLVNRTNHEERLPVTLLSYTLRSTLLEYTLAQIEAGNDAAEHRRAEELLRQRSAPWHLTGIEVDLRGDRLDTWELLLRAAVTFARSPGIAQATRAPIPRNVARAAARFKAELPDSGVQVIDLRRRAVSRYSDDDAPSSGRALTQRVIVRGHWRRQACGPNHSERRLTWIDQHLRGPEDAEVKGVHRVYFGRRPQLPLPIHYPSEREALTGIKPATWTRERTRQSTRRWLDARWESSHRRGNPNATS